MGVGGRVSVSEEGESEEDGGGGRVSVSEEGESEEDGDGGKGECE